MKKPQLSEKAILNSEEVCILFDFSKHKYQRFVREAKDLPFMAYYKKRRIIIRKILEKYLYDNPEIKEMLKSGERCISKKT